jgi:hypothetical protein
MQFTGLSTEPSPVAAKPKRPPEVKPGRPNAADPNPHDDDDEGEPFDYLSLLKPFGNAPAWGISFAVHAVIFLFLSTIVQHEDIQALTSLVSTIEDVEPEMNFDAVAIDQAGTSGDLNSLTSSEALTTARGDNPQTAVQRQVDEQVLPPTIRVGDEVEMPADEAMISTVNVAGRAATQTTGGVEGAIDILAIELAASLKERKTLVVWLFDRSLSLKDRRDAIADRFENVYQQLGALQPDSDRFLKSAVASFGEKTTIITPEPVDDIREVIPAVRKLPNDESGKENVFTAVEEVTRKFGAYRQQSHRNMLLFIVTDERGDDYAKLETVIQSVRRNGIRCYVVGNAAPFGREKGYMTFKADDNYEFKDVPVDQGPETVAPEALRLGFWGPNAYDLERMSSQYGPYALTRLCAESGGMFLIAGDDRQAKRFDPAVMRNYAPDYRPIRDYDAQLKKNKAKAALVMAAGKTSVDHVPIPQLGFRADTDTVLRQEITEAQKPAAALDYRLNEMLEMLTQGEKDREKLTEPRWQASYDLAMGRVLAMRVRAFGYNTVLAEMKATPKTFQTKGHNHWRLVPSKEITSGPNVKKLAVKASTYLKRIIDDHPGTPWALLAEKELSQPMGWEWQEDHVNYPGGLEKDGKPNLLLLADEEAKKKEMQKKKAAERPQPKL